MKAVFACWWHCGASTFMIAGLGVVFIQEDTGFKNGSVALAREGTCIPSPFLGSAQTRVSTGVLTEPNANPDGGVRCTVHLPKIAMLRLLRLALDQDRAGA